jgi:hypothetical protein
MFSVMTWDLEDFERPAANAEQAVKERYAHKLKQISKLTISAEPDLVGAQEVLAGHKDLAPRVFDDLREALGPEWNGYLSQLPDPRGIRVGWLARGQLSNPTDVAVNPQRVSAITIDDDGNQVPAVTASKRGALGVIYTRGDGLVVQALTAHLKSKLLTFPGHDPNIPASTRATRPNGPPSASTRCTSRPPRPSPSGPGPPTGCKARDRNAMCWCAATSTTPPRRPPPSSCLGSGLAAGHRRVCPAGLGRRQPAVEPGPPRCRPAIR